MTTKRNKTNDGGRPQEIEDGARRQFLGKALYATPTLISLGLLTQGGDARAQGNGARTEDFGTPPSLEPGSSNEPIPPPE